MSCSHFKNLCGVVAVGCAYQFAVPPVFPAQARRYAHATTITGIARVGMCINRVGWALRSRGDSPPRSALM